MNISEFYEKLKDPAASFEQRVALWKANPQFHAEKGWLVSEAAVFSSSKDPIASQFLEYLIESGLDVNTVHVVELIVHAACIDNTDTVRMLLRHGAKVNTRINKGKEVCGFIASAVRHGNLEMVQMLVDAGAALNVIDFTNRTPLQWAIDYRKPEIADYLRSKGCLEARFVEGYEPPEAKSPLVRAVEYRFGDADELAWVPILPEEPRVAVRYCIHEDYFGLFTEGMSSRPLTVPPGMEEFQYAELALPLWDWEQTPGDWSQPQYVWAINWMRRLAHYPHQHKTWYTNDITIVANEDPPEPLSEFTPMSCWLLIPKREPFGQLKLLDGKKVIIYTMLPIYAEEREFELKHGMNALLQRFQDHEVPMYLDANRPCVA